VATPSSTPPVDSWYARVATMDAMTDHDQFDDHDLQRIYDRFAPGYRWTALLSDVPLGARALRRWLMGRATGHVLDVACGTGENLPFLPSAAAVTAVDLSPQMLARARRRAERLRRDVDLRQMSAQALDFPDGAFDTVTTAMSTCTFPDPVGALREMARVTRPGGRVLLLEHGRSRIEWIGRFQDRRAERHYRAAGCRWNQDVLALVADAGLAVEAARTRTWGVVTAIVALPAMPDGR
jgi:ubiquinone/menaquinone biosynthesis C-methylase UbiE